MPQMTGVYLAIKAFIVSNRRLIVTLIHVVQTALASYLAFLVRFEFVLQSAYVSLFAVYLPLLIIIRTVLFLSTGLHKDLWRYSSVYDLLKLTKTVLVGSVVFYLLVHFAFGATTYPRSVFILDALFLILISGGSRLLIRVFREYLRSEKYGKRVLIIGAGDAGEMIARDMKNNPRYNYEPVGFIDDDPYKKDLEIHDLPIFGGRDRIPAVIQRYKPEEVIVAIPSASGRVLKQYYDCLAPFALPVKTLPGINQILDGKVSVSQIKPIALEDLLQREPVRTDIESVSEFIRGKKVLVTGAGGSIGSELCRQIMAYGPAWLILLDRYENSLFFTELELRRSAGGGTSLQGGRDLPRVVPVVADMLDREGMIHLFAMHRPEVVFHAAAHKHVPLMEQNPLEAVRNNVFGTRNLIDASLAYDVSKFVMISTDKAVNPTNVMGATKRIAEFMAMNSSGMGGSRFTTVRFGNVLGSNGSVVQVFKNQIAQGLPLTVTHPDITRFFMLIPEAVQLVLIAAASGKGGEILVLDMGEPVRIIDLAENVIRFSGLIPHEDVKIEFTGLRPGEKLYEELFDESEVAVPSFHDKIRVAVSHSLPSPEVLKTHLAELERIVASRAEDEVIPALKRMIPGFKKDGSEFTTQG